MKIILNGKQMQMDEGKDQIEYDTVANMAGTDPARNPTVTFSSSRGDGSICRGQRIIVADGMIINCLVTGSA